MCIINSSEIPAVQLLPYLLLIFQSDFNLCSICVEGIILSPSSFAHIYSTDQNKLSVDGSVGKCKQKALSESRKVKHIALFHLHHGLALWDELSKYTLYCITALRLCENADEQKISKIYQKSKVLK